MTTTIVPAAGQGALYTQQGPGTTPGYAALDDRRLATVPLQEGVYGTTTTVTAGGVSSVASADFMVTQRAAGANLSVDINMPGGGFALIQGDTIAGQGLYGVPVHASNINEVVASADLTNPRVDQVILEIQDNAIDASGGNLSRTRILTGTPTSGANLTNRSGAQALPGNALLLADYVVAANATTIPNSVIRDRRKWARGAYMRIVRTAADYTSTSTTLVDIDGTNLKQRIELSGVPVRTRLEGTIRNSAAGSQTDIDIGVDSSPVGYRMTFGDTGYAALTNLPLHYERDIGSAAGAGSHLVGPMWVVSSGSGVDLLADSTYPAVFTVEEIVKPAAQNSNGVTTG